MSVSSRNEDVVCGNAKLCLNKTLYLSNALLSDSDEVGDYDKRGVFSVVEGDCVDLDGIEDSLCISFFKISSISSL